MNKIKILCIVRLEFLGGLMEFVLDACKIFLSILQGFTFYFTFIIILGFLFKRKIKDTDKKLKYAVLVPARNEEECIHNIIKSIQNQDYDSNLIDLYVLVNNCTDNTEQEARRLGVNVILSPSSAKNKGMVINSALTELLPKDYDAFIVFDADNIANKNFVTEFNKAFGNGAQVVKSRIFAQDSTSSMIASLYDIFFCFANQFLNKSRFNLGITAKIIGTGFGVTADYFREIGGYRTKTITEDVEFFAIHASKGVNAVFVRDAITYDEQPSDFKTTLIQRKRWMSGSMQVFQDRLLEIIKGFFKRKSCINSFDTFMQLGFTYLQAFIPFLFFINLISLNGESLFDFLFVVFYTYFTIGFGGLCALILEKRFKFHKNTIMAVFFYPFFLLTFIPLQTIALFSKTKVWKEIHHNGADDAHLYDPTS